MNIREKISLLLHSPLFAKIERESAEAIQTKREKAAPAMENDIAEELAVAQDFAPRFAAADAVVWDAWRAYERAKESRAQLTADFYNVIGPIQNRISEQRNYLHRTSANMIGQFQNWCEAARRHMRNNHGTTAATEKTLNGSTLHLRNPLGDRISSVMAGLHVAYGDAELLRMEAVPADELLNRFDSILAARGAGYDDKLFCGFPPFAPPAESEALGLHVA